MANVFKSFRTILNKASKEGVAANMNNSLKWFRTELGRLNIVTERKMLFSKELETVKRPLLGRMYMFGYDPKHKDTLPYYDRFPLIILAGKAKGGFYGLNLHYLSPNQRAIFFDLLRQKTLTTSRTNDDVARFVISFSKLINTAALKAYAPCWKHYLTDHVKTKIMQVPYEFWEPALFLPTESFAKSSKNTVWKESLKQFK